MALKPPVPLPVGTDRERKVHWTVGCCARAVTPPSEAALLRFYPFAYDSHVTPHLAWTLSREAYAALLYLSQPARYGRWMEKVYAARGPIECRKLLVPVEICPERACAPLVNMVARCMLWTNEFEQVGELFKRADLADRDAPSVGTMACLWAYAELKLGRPVEAEAILVNTKLELPAAARSQFYNALLDRARNRIEKRHLRPEGQ